MSKYIKEYNSTVVLLEKIGEAYYIHKKKVEKAKKAAEAVEYIKSKIH